MNYYRLSKSDLRGSMAVEPPRYIGHADDQSDQDKGCEATKAGQPKSQLVLPNSTHGRAAGY